MIFHSKVFLVGSMLTLASLFGCGQSHQDEQFKLVSVSAGDLYRLQVNTGALHKVEGGTLFKVVETDRIKLRVGGIYILEDGKTMKYLGQGTFEPFKADVLTWEEYLKRDEGKK